MIQPSNNPKWKNFLRHALLWISIYVIYTYMMSYYDELYGRMLVNLVNVPLFMAAYYLLKHVQIPYFYNQGNMPAFVLSIAASAFLWAAICRLNGIWWMDAYFGQDSNATPFMTPGMYLIKTVRFYTPAMAILAWEAHQERRREMERMQVLEKEKLATELKFLKAQINPHFLFNTLNNLYANVLTQSPQAPDMIMRLSGMLDYVLYKSQKTFVPLREELQSIEHFLELEQIRYGERLSVDFSTTGDLSVPISPLILLSLVENAFKHGASGDIDFPRIKIEIFVENQHIHARVWNTKAQQAGELNDAYKEGIGLSNIQRQLNLIYPKRHDLKIQDSERAFSVSLSIQPTYEYHQVPVGG